MTDGDKRCSCGQGCPTMGYCLRNKGIKFNGVFATRSAGAGYGDATAQKAWDKELDEYRDARAQGIQPASTKTKDIRDAVEVSNTFGDAYDATKPADFAVKHILKEDA